MMSRDEAKERLCHQTLGCSTMLRCKADSCMAWKESADGGNCGLVLADWLETLVDQISRCSR